MGCTARRIINIYISLWDVEEHANTERFQGLPSLLPRLCPLSKRGYKFTPRAVASPDAPQQPLVRKRARSGGANWVQVSRMVAPSPAKKPRTGGSQQPACDHKEHQILSASEAAAFAAQFWDKKTHPTKASQHEFLATCIDVDLEQNVKHADSE